MEFELPRLPYDTEALAPHLSAEMLAVHHDRHHASYVRKLNELVAGSRTPEVHSKRSSRRLHRVHCCVARPFYPRPRTSSHCMLADSSKLRPKPDAPARLSPAHEAFPGAGRSFEEIFSGPLPFTLLAPFTKKWL